MISSKFFIINQGMELGDKTPISPLMGAKPSLVLPFPFSFLPFFFFFFFFFFNLQRLVNGSASLRCIQGLKESEQVAEVSPIFLEAV